MTELAPLLRLVNVTKRFGGLVAVDQVSLEIHVGEMFAIVGPNGAGKTTLFNIISGVFVPEEGHIYFEGEEITNLPIYKKAPLGIGRTFQIPRPFGSASVRENIAIGAMFGSLAGKVSVDGAMEIADRYIELVGLQEHRDKPAGGLTPVEAMAGMNPRDIDEMVDFLKRIKEEEGVAIVAMVEHIMRAVVGLAERVMVMHQGAKLIDTTTEEALSHPEVIDVYLGKAPEQ